MSYKDQNWNNRLAGGLGDEAEAKFTEWADEIGLGYARYGIDLPPIQVHRLDAFIRYTPDYLMSGKLVEVQGFGRDQKFKLKQDKLMTLLEWDTYHPVFLFAWDRTNERRFMVPIGELHRMSSQVPTGFFDGNKLYYEFSADLLASIGELV